MPDTHTPTAGLREFDPTSKIHVIWLQEFTNIINQMGSVTDPMQLSRQVQLSLANNPMKVKIPMEAFIDTHAGISIKYAGNVLEGSAWIPPPK